MRYTRRTRHKFLLTNVAYPAPRNRPHRRVSAGQQVSDRLSASMGLLYPGMNPRAVWASHHGVCMSHHDAWADRHDVGTGSQVFAHVNVWRGLLACRRNRQSRSARRAGLAHPRRRVRCDERHSGCETGLRRSWTVDTLFRRSCDLP